MSDGNFNRSLLPHTPFQSGLNAGKSMGRMNALAAFKDYLIKYCPELTENQFAEHIDHFRRLLSSRLK